MKRALTLATGAALVAALALGACNQSAPGKKDGGDTAGGLDPNAPGATPPPTTVPPTTTPTPVAAPPCRSGDLSLSRLAEDAGAGQRQVTYAFTNNGPAACSLKGYPTLVGFDADGKRTDGITIVQSEAQFFETGGPPTDVNLAPKGRAVFFIAFTGIQVTDKPCIVVARLQITPPGNTQAIELQDTLSVCNEQIRLTPVRSYAAAQGVGGSLSM